MFEKVSSGYLFETYSNLWEYRRLHPEFIPSKKSEKIMSIGHENSYADIIWIRLIQFIGDNAANGKYIDFTHNILSHVTFLSPYFIRAYELDLIMAPLIYQDDSEEKIQKDKATFRAIISHGKMAMDILCDKNKLIQIRELPMNEELWNNKQLRNPCLNGMIPYYIGYHYYNVFHDGKNAEYYYKIASMQDDAPTVSQILGILAQSVEGNNIQSALSFFLIASTGYDQEPYQCRTLAKELARDLMNKRELNLEWIQKVSQMEMNLNDGKDSSIPESYSATNCFDSLERGLKQFYIGFIKDLIETSHPDITDSRELVKRKIIPFTPSIQSQRNFFIVKKENGLWKYATTY